jgi:hypothetical protein
MTTFDDHSIDAEALAPPSGTATPEPDHQQNPDHQQSSVEESMRRRKSWVYVAAALALGATLAIGYLVGYSTSGVSTAKSQRNHAQAMVAKTQQELAATQAKLAKTQGSLAGATAKGSACSAYATSLNATVKTAVGINQAVDDFFNSQPGSAAETAAINRGSQLYDQFEQQRGAANALAAACTGTAL